MSGSVATAAGVGEIAPAAARVERLRGWLQRDAVRPVELVETHLSWLLLADAIAYKLKKPIALPFADFRSLAARRHFCAEEVRLNRRWSPALYLGVSRVSGSDAAPEFDGDGPELDAAVRMRRFPAGALLAERAVAGTLAAADLDRLAQRLAALQAAAPRAAPGGGYGSAERRAAVAGASLDGVLALDPSRGAALASLRGWLHAEAAALAPRWRERLAAGFVREGHGDLHLANLLRLDGEVDAFDAIEFDPALRWIDIVDDAAFVAMDLLAHGLAPLAWRFVNAWLDAGGDHEGLPLWRFAMVARALVRAQVALIRAGQGGAVPAPRPSADDYLGVARRLAPAPADARLLLTHGLPGAGKSSVALQLLEQLGAIRLRADVERKRLFGLSALADTRALAPALDVYGAAATQRTYARLATMARVALQAGWPTIVDASFLRRDERAAFAALAGELRVPFAILDCRASPQQLVERVAARRARGRDASEADETVLAMLSASREPLLDAERARALVVDTAQPIDVGQLAAAWRRAR